MEPDRLSVTPTGGRTLPTLAIPRRLRVVIRILMISFGIQTIRDPEEAYNHMQEDAARQSPTAGPSRIRDLVYSRHRQDLDSDSDATVDLN